ncbi:MAG: hypothetical protein PUA56_03015 [Bacillales bacterium]|nr:hypothetical protein [Bacillales bacterium]
MFGNFLKDLFGVFVRGFLGLFFTIGTTANGTKYYGGILGGLFQMFDISQYVNVFKNNTATFKTWEWILAVLITIVLVAVMVGIIILFIYGVRILFKKLSKRKIDEDLINEVNRLRREYLKTQREKDRLIDYCLQHGIKTSAISDAISDGSESEEGTPATGESRFYKLTEVDKMYKSGDVPTIEYDNEITLEQICDRFRLWACSEMHLFYQPRVIRLFFASFATTRIIILQGISGTGKTSLPYSVGQWLDNPATIASVQPSWRDRTEIFGYFNEFTKRFNETQILKKMYEARWNEQIYLTVIDEANIARVEYYFAELLSILEMPSRDNWIVDIVPSGWDSDPHFIEKGRFKLPENMWYICTINNDDSTFAISDKVYDRAMPININSKGVPFEVSEEERNPNHLYVSYKHLEEMFKEAQIKYTVSEENLRKFDEMDDYVIEHFRLAFGNRIVKQLKEFVPAYVACGGTEIDGLDYVLCNKILRKFESLNLAYIRDEIDGYIDYLNEHFGEENMQESKEYLQRLKKLF